MRKPLLIIPLAALLLSGCATYKYQTGKPPYDKGYVVSYNGKVIPEYTLGKDNTVPADKGLAKKRFKRRHGKVEHYYKRMGYIESRAKETFLNPPIAFFKLIGGFFRLPFIAISDYKYDHNPAYREKIKRSEEQKDAWEEARINKLKSDLAFYIQEDLLTKEKEGIAPAPKKGVKPRRVKAPPRRTEKIQPVPAKAEVETPMPGAVMPSPSLAAKQEEAILAQEKQAKPAKPKAAAVKKPKAKPAAKKTYEPVAVITARPVKGFSPLTVKFSGARSYSRGNKITSYSWDFGDGDTSAKPNPANTYYSGSFMPQIFTVTLTVEDNRGQNATSSTEIQVMNK